MKKFLFYLFLLNCVFYAQSHIKPVKDSLLLKEVVITGTKYENSRNNIPFTVSSISSEEINKRGDYNVLNVVQNEIPGVFLTERSILGFGASTNSAGSIGMRGVRNSPNTGVLILLNGQPQFMGIFGHPISDSYVSTDVERIEVIRGPASMLYGTNAMGGVINIITKKQNQTGFISEVNFSKGAYNTSKSSLSIGYKLNDVSVFASFNSDKTDGLRDYSDFKISNGFAKINYDFSDALKLSLDYNLASTKANDPGPSYEPSKFSINIKRGKFSTELTNNFSSVEGALQLFYNYGTHDLSDGWYSTDKNTGMLLYETGKILDNWTVTIGTDYKKFGGKTNWGEAKNMDKSIVEKAAYLHTSYSIYSKLIATAGLRIENNSAYKNITVPVGGLSYLMNDNITLKTSVSKGFRSPTIWELYMFAPSPFFAPANPDLKPETILNYEAGFIYGRKAKSSSAFESYSMEFTYYYSKVKDMIVQTSKLINMNSQQNRGVELTSKIKLKSGLDLSLNYSYLNADTSLSAMPKQILFVEGLYRIDNAVAGINLKYVGDYYTVSTVHSWEPEKYKKQFFATLNMFCSYSVGFGFNVILNINNILDRQYEINDGYVMPGRNFSAGVRFSY